MSDGEFGFKTGDLEIINAAVSGFPEIKKAVIFGSRAKGNYKPGSDVDIAVWTTDADTLGKLYVALNDDTLLPYKFDILNYDTINNPDLKQQIDVSGVEIYISQQ